MLLCRFTQALLDILQYHAGQEMCLESGFLYHVANDDGEMLLTHPVGRLIHPNAENGLHCISALTDAARTVDMHASISLHIWGESFLRFLPAAGLLRPTRVK